MKVRDVMTRPVVAVGSGTPFRRLVELMDEHRISGIPVTDDAGSVLGVVTEGDLIVKEHRPDHIKLKTPFGSADELHERRRRVEGLVAGELMTAPAVTVDVDADLRVAARLMTLHAVARVPVTKNGKLTGIVSRGDVLKVFLRSDADIEREIDVEVLTRRVLEDVPDLAVDVSEGVVTLRGVVAKRSTARLLAFHVDRLDGVTKVNDLLGWWLDDLTSPVRLPPPPVGPIEQVL